MAAEPDADRQDGQGPGARLRPICIVATMHGKEEVLAPVLAPLLGAEIRVAEGLDTDRFGSFCGAVGRPHDARTAARLKAAAGLGLHPEADFAVSSEGSFGPHPALPLIAAGLELVLLLGRDGLEVWGQDLTPRTNHRRRTVRTLDEALEFAASIGFPGHGLMVASPLAAGGDVADPQTLAKGVADRLSLERLVLERLEARGSAVLEADMRAHLNPTRMTAIGRAARDLAANHRCACPACGRPGFVVTAMRRGRPCEDCGAETRQVLSRTRVCAGCGQSRESRIDGPAPASSCDRCNP